MKFIKHIIIPFSTVLILGLIVGSLHETTSSIIKPLSIILALMCIVAVINMIYFIIYLVKKDERKNEPKQQNHVVKYSEIKETSNKKQKKKFVFKTPDDKLYEEAVRYFGKSYSKGFDKYDLIDEYLKEN